jgi:hypothetical protein
VFIVWPNSVADDKSRVAMTNDVRLLIIGVD